MGEVACGDQNRMIRSGFANIAHFQKCYKKSLLRIVGFSFFQGFTAWYLEVNIPEIIIRCGQPKLDI